jgi:hypothetical protein
MICSRRLKAAMTPHDEVKIMRAPGTAPRTEALAVERGGEVGINGHTRPGAIRRAGSQDEPAPTSRRECSYSWCGVMPFSE